MALKSIYSYKSKVVKPMVLFHAKYELKIESNKLLLEVIKEPRLK